MDYRLNYKINNHAKQFDVKASFFKRGKDEILFNSRLFSNNEFLDNGYIIRKFPTEWKSAISDNITTYIKNKLINLGLSTSSEITSFSLEKYHTFVNQARHQQVVNSFRGGMFGFGGIPLEVLGVSHTDLDDYINSSVQTTERLSCQIKKFGMTHGKFWIRIVRPKLNDNNPPHKDSHLKRLRKCVNIYLPLAGSNEYSSLPLIPQSHNEKESNYIISSSPSFVNGKRNTVPCIVHRDKGLDMICPNPSPNDIMIFTPHLIHGGGVNSNEDLTRVSLEMRFFQQ